MSHLFLSLLGTWQVTLDGEPITTFESDKVRALLAYLAVEADRPHNRESLATLFWPERSNRNGRANLSQALYNLRGAIGDRQSEPPFLNIKLHTIQFNRQSSYWLDVRQFTNLLDDCERHEHQSLAACSPCQARQEEAVALYNGDFLTGISPIGSLDFDEWLLLKREQYQRRMVNALHDLVRIYQLDGAFEQALPYARRQVALSPWHEAAQQQLIYLLARNGRRGEALVQYEAYRQLLWDELAVEPARGTTALAVAIRAGLAEFEKYMPTNLVHQLTSADTRAKLGGEKRELTILFSDIAGFNAISDSNEPEALMGQLSTYLSELATIIIAHNGTVDKYLGDGLMALWGAPLYNPDHIKEACRAALHCREKVSELNAVWAQQGKPLFPTRISIHTGEAFVGAVGPVGQADYTVLGNSVNLGLRLLKVNTVYDIDIVISYDTYRQVANFFYYRMFDAVNLIDGQEPVMIGELIGEKGHTEPEQAALARQFTTAYERYTARKWQEATQSFAALAKQFPEDSATEIYLVRCQKLLENPPGNNWRPVYHLSKAKMRTKK